MKKLLLGLGAVGAVVAPVASVVACSSTKDITIDVTNAITAEDVAKKLVSITKEMQETIKGDIDGVNFKIIDGDRTLNLSIDENTSKADQASFGTKLIKFFTKSYSDRGFTMPTGTLFPQGAN